MALQRAVNSSGSGKRSIVSSLALALFLLFTFILPLHHHDDGDHADCFLCIAGHHASLVHTTSVSLDVHQPPSVFEVTQESLLFASLLLTKRSSRAPPV
ncbi:MAG: hypothetical protein AB1805_16910 [Nitrospirota bacterium]